MPNISSQKQTFTAQDQDKVLNGLCAHLLANVKRNPFTFGLLWGLLRGLRFEYRDTPGFIAATNCTTKVTLGPRFFEIATAKISDAMFILLHEVMHCALGHDRYAKVTPYRIMNVAMDLLINTMLAKVGIVMPSMRKQEVNADLPSLGIFPSNIFPLLTVDKAQWKDEAAFADWVLASTSLEIFQMLMRNIPNIQIEDGDIEEDAGETNKIQQGEIRRRAVSAAKSLASSHPSVPGAYSIGESREFELVGGSLVPWQEILQREVAPGFRDLLPFDFDALSQLKESTGFLSYQYRHVGDKARIYIGVDTSGSIDHKTLSVFVSQIFFLKEEWDDTEVVFYWVDTSHYGPYFPESSEEILNLKPQGGGGTDFTTFFAEIAKDIALHPDRSTSVVMFTDLQVCLPPFSPYPCNTFWVVPYYPGIPSTQWGKTIVMPPQE